MKARSLVSYHKGINETAVVRCHRGQYRKYFDASVIKDQDGNWVTSQGNIVTNVQELVDEQCQQLNTST